MWSCATSLMVYRYWWYSWYIITDYTEGILFNKIEITCYFTYGVLLLIMLMVYLLILLLINLRESCFIRLWSCATLHIVYIVTDYTEGILFNNICDHVLLYPLYIVTDCTDGILLLIILRESCLIIFVITCSFNHCIFLLIVLMVYYYWLYWGNPV